MKPWQPGDPVGSGCTILTGSDKQAYAEECKRQQVESLAMAIINNPTISARRDAIERLPERLRDAVKQRVRELWEQQR